MRALDCDKYYNRKGNLYNHSLTYKNHRSHVCTWTGCVKAFNRSDALGKHVRVVHLGWPRRGSSQDGRPRRSLLHATLHFPRGRRLRHAHAWKGRWRQGSGPTGYILPDQSSILCCTAQTIANPSISKNTRIQCISLRERYSNHHSKHRAHDTGRSTVINSSRSPSSSPPPSPAAAAPSNPLASLNAVE